MKNVINNYCRDESIKNGLILLDMPTGSGKTHSVLDFIHDYVVSGGENRIFFITTLLKNLPEDELKKRFERSGNLPLFKEKYLRIASNADSVCQFFQSKDDEIKKHRENIPLEIKLSDEYKNLKNDVEWINKNALSKSADDRKYSARIKLDMQQHSERQFRYYLERKLAEQFKTSNERKEAILSKDNWKWVADMYPAVFTKDRQIIFLSINKFLARNNTIIDPSYLFYNNDIIKDSYIFIDEFDATKDTMLATIIENGIRGKQDTLELFIDIHNALNSDIRKFPAILSVESENNKKRKQLGKLKKDFTPDRIIKSFQEIANKIFSDYRFDLSFKTEKTTDDSQRKFLFHDHRFHSISGGAAKIIINESDKLNYIKFGGKTLEDDKDSVSVMLGRVRGFLSYFQRGVKSLALNYQNLKNERKASNDDVFTYEFAIKSILHEFHLKDRQIEYLTSAILDSAKNNEIASSPYDLSLYEKGFRLYDFQDDFEHDMQSIVMMENFQLTPEKILLRVCEKAKVIGISATATIPSVIGNYDLDYLRRHLGTNFHNIDEEQRAALKRQFIEATAHYDRVNIETLAVSAEVDGEYSVDSWKQIIDNDELAEGFYNTVANSVSNDDNDFNAKRYLRIAIAYNFFAKHDDIKSFLCVLNKYPKEKDDALSLRVIQDLCNKIEKYNNGCPQNKIEILTGDDFESEKSRISDRLSKGDKVFVISIYQAIGSGQNLQYKIPKELIRELVQINDFEPRQEKDYDAIYLDNPTNLLVNLNNDITEAEFAKYLFQVEFLRERVEISDILALKHIRFAFQNYSTHNRPKVRPERLSDKKSVKFLSTRLLIQAIGRICRTNMKNKNIYILVDKEILTKIDKTYFIGRLSNREFEKVLELVCELHNTDDGSEVQIDKSNLNAERANTYIRNLLKGDWTSEKIKQWEKLRNFVLTYPTISQTDIPSDCDSASIVEYMYAQMPKKASKLFFAQNGDYTEVDVSFTKDEKHCQEVSDKDARLDLLMKVEGVKRLFESKGYAINFFNNEYILSPTLYNNIYKGALGEVIGCWTIKNQIGYSLESIQDENIYECLDFKLKDKSIYFDMKHWHESMDADKEFMYEKIKSKLIRCGGKIAVIINMLSEYDYAKFKSHDLDGLCIIEIPYLYKIPTMELNYEALRQLKGVIDELSD